MKYAHTIDIINELKSQGVSVSYKKRKDGGYLIKSINGTRFKGADGNKVARQMTGQALPEHLQTQRQQAKTSRQSYYSRLDKQTRSQLLKTQKAWKSYKTKKAESGETPVRGKISLKQAVKSFEKYGEQSTLEYLKRAEQYSRGFAYSENVLNLIARLENQSKTDTDADYSKVITYLKNNVSSILEEEQFQKILNILYDIEKGVYPDTRVAVRNMEIVLGI